MKKIKKQLVKEKLTSEPSAIREAKFYRKYYETVKVGLEPDFSMISSSTLIRILTRIIEAK